MKRLGLAGLWAMFALATLVAACADGGDDDAAADDDVSRECAIDGETIPAGMTDPENVCRVCDPVRSATAWSDNDHADCDDGVFCNGLDRCSGGWCVDHGRDPCVNDLFCDGQDSCDETGRRCLHTGDPCPPWGYCDEVNLACGAECPCAGNHPPALLETYYLVNEQFVSPPIIIGAEDLFGVYFSYEDPDCNLPYGVFWRNIDGEGYKASDDPIVESLGCSTADNGLVYGFPMTNPMMEGEHSYAVYWTDCCGAPSNEMTGGWSVVP